MSIANKIGREELIRSVIPVSIAGTVINNSYSLQDQGYDTEVPNFIVPSFLLFFSGPLSANIIYKQMVVDRVLLASYAIGVMLFFLIRKYKHIRKVTFLFPVILRTNFLFSVRSIDKPMHSVIMWMTMAEFHGLILKKMFLEGGKLYFVYKDIKVVLENALVTLLIRYFNIPYYFIYSFILLFETSEFINYFTFLRKPIAKKRGKKKKSILKN